tara:strand:- start:2 stop:739 length:738 start_codon:yes stop_codon:yes gene_type:complete
MEKHYKLLGLETTATLEEAQERFNVLSKEYDPEKQEGELKEFFKSEQEKVKEAYKEICLHLIRKKEEEEEEEEEEEFDWEEAKDKVIEEKEEQEYRRTIHDNDDESDLEITSKSKDGLDKMVYWSKFLSVVGYIFLGFLTLLTAKLFIEYQDIPSRRSHFPFDFKKDEQLMVYVIFIIIWLSPVRYLNKFASKTREYLTSNNNKELGEGLENLGSFFKFYGVIMILWLLFVLYSFSEANIWNEIF